MVSCKEWNTGGHPAPLTDQDPYGAEPRGAWLNRVHGYEVGEGEGGRTVHFPKSCLHCEHAACVTVCPTGASYKRAEDGIVLVDEALCIGCGLCAWACPYGARELDADRGVMKKCTLCIDRIYNANLAEEDRIPACVRRAPRARATSAISRIRTSAASRLVAERGGFDLMPELGYAPTNKYLPPRPRQAAPGCTGAAAAHRTRRTAGRVSRMARSRAHRLSCPAPSRIQRHRSSGAGRGLQHIDHVAGPVRV